MVKTKKTNKKKYLVSLDENLINNTKKMQVFLGGADNLSGLINTLLERWYTENKEITKEYECHICGGKTEGLYISTCEFCREKQLNKSKKNDEKTLG